MHAILSDISLRTNEAFTHYSHLHVLPRFFFFFYLFSCAMSMSCDKRGQAPASNTSYHTGVRDSVIKSTHFSEMIQRRSVVWKQTGH